MFSIIRKSILVNFAIERKSRLEITSMHVAQHVYKDKLWQAEKYTRLRHDMEILRYWPLWEKSTVYWLLKKSVMRILDTFFHLRMNQCWTISEVAGDLTRDDTYETSL